MKRFLKGGLAGLFLLLLLLGTTTVHTIVKSQSYGRLINYCGIVRGATQRLVKLELEGRPSDELVAYVDGILSELMGAEGPYGLARPHDAAYLENLNDLNTMWGRLKQEIAAFRAGGEEMGALLALSERFFEQANDTVFSAEAYSSRQIKTLLGGCIGMLGVMLVTWLFIFWAASRKLLSLESSNRELGDLARRDPLTGAYQFEAFKEAAQRLLDTEKDLRFAVVYTDFADFKYFNDVFGYTYGDRILKNYGGILLEGLREKELCGRVAADNFVLLLHYRERGEVAARQRQADRRITDFMHNSYDRQFLPTCCGICCVEDVIEELRIDGLLDRANFARKTVKTKANPNYVYYDEGIRNRLREEKVIESRMQEALERREFTVYYQPKVALATGKIAAAEALVRWRLEDGAVIPPDRFIPVFEQKFMIGRLDQYVFEEVCRWLRRRLDAGESVVPVSVNVSRLQFYDQEFVNRYVELRDRHRVPPELLEIEFTESLVVDNSALLVKTVTRLKQAGFSCSIDDFGKGYSSLSMLKDLPVDTLKLDRFFFEEGNNRERDRAVVRGVIELVKKFNIRTVAEGIESQEQVDYLRDAGCDYVQGFVFYRPMPEREFEEKLRGRPAAPLAEPARPVQAAPAF